MKNFNILSLALLLSLASCSGPDDGGVDVVVPPAETITIVSQPDSISFDYNFEQDEEVEFKFALKAVTSDLAPSSISTIPATSDNFNVSIVKGDSTNRFIVKLRAKQSAKKINKRAVESVKLCVTYGDGLEVVSEPFDIVFPEVITSPTFISQPDTVVFAPYFVAGTTTSFEFEIENAGAKSDEMDIALLRANEYFTFSCEPTNDEDIYKATLTATQTAVDAVVDARQDSVKRAKNHYIIYTNLTLSHDKLKHPDNSSLFRVMFVMDDIAPSVDSELPAADLLMNFRTDTTAVSTFVVDPGTKAIDPDSFTAETNEYFTVEFAEGVNYNEYCAIFTPTEAAVAKTEAFTEECEVSIAYDDSLEVNSSIDVNFAADADVLPHLVGELDSVALETLFEVGEELTINFEVCPGSRSVGIDNFTVIDNDLFSATFVQGDRPTQYVMTLAAEQGAVDASAKTTEAMSLSNDLVLVCDDGDSIALGAFVYTIPPKVSLDMDIQFVASTSVVYRVEIGGLSDEDVIDKGVVRTQDSTLNVSEWDKWKHGATNLAYLGIKDKLTAGGRYFLRPFVELPDGTIAYGDQQAFTTYLSSDDVPRKSNVKWFWSDSWFVAGTWSKYHKSTDPKSETDEKALVQKEKIARFMDLTCYYYGVYCGRNKNMWVQYNTSVNTSNSLVYGTHINFGHNFGFSTALHEMSHAMGTGGSKYDKLISGGTWKGEYANQFIQELTNKRTAKIKGDGTHFWPYNMNYSSEYKSEADAIEHVLAMQALIKDGM